MDATNDMTKALTHLTHRVSFLEEENRWLKSQLFGRSSEKRPQDIAVEQARLFNEAECLANVAADAAESVTIIAHTRKKSGKKKIDPHLPRIDVIMTSPKARRSAHTMAQHWSESVRRSLSSAFRPRSGLRSSGTSVTSTVAPAAARA
jgi:hypothetical protein